MSARHPYQCSPTDSFGVYGNAKRNTDPSRGVKGLCGRGSNAKAGLTCAFPYVEDFSCLGGFGGWYDAYCLAGLAPNGRGILVTEVEVERRGSSGDRLAMRDAAVPIMTAGLGNLKIARYL